MERAGIDCEGGVTMNSLIFFAGLASLLGCAAIGGVFFAFSSFVMKALSRLPSSEGIAAMQSINIVVLNPSFIGVFMGTAVLSLGMASVALRGWPWPSAPFFIIGAVLYLAGTFLVTLIGNVPLNKRLAAISATDPEASDVWEHYLEKWTMLNSLRAAAALIAALMFIIGLLQ